MGKSLLKGGSPLGMLADIATAQGAKPESSDVVPTSTGGPSNGSAAQAEGRAVTVPPGAKIAGKDGEEGNPVLGEGSASRGEETTAAPRFRERAISGRGAASGRRQQTYYMDEGVIRRLKIYSAQSGRRISEIVNTSVTEHLSKPKS